MIFSSLTFIFRFLPIFFLIYYLVSPNKRNLILVIGSFLFYSFGGLKYIFLMLLSIIIDFTMGILIERFQGNRKLQRYFLICSIVFNLGILIIFKYSSFIVDNFSNLFNMNIDFTKLILPLGISFYTFQTMSYTIDVFRGTIKAEKNFIDFAAFVSLFPQLIAGPIVKYSHIEKTLKVRELNKTNIEEGIELFILGLGQKVLIANNVGMLWDEILNMKINEIPTILAWLGIVAFGLQIYFDFNGYSLMAIGLGKMLGFNFPINFNYPYISRSITEFWRRWHITLRKWFEEYLYIPLGGNRKGLVKGIRNLAIVWICTGLWHGAEINFLLWGLYFFILIVVEKMFLKEFLEKKKVFSHIYTIILLCVGWVIFELTNINDIYLYVSRLFIFKNGEFFYYFRNYLFILLIGVILATPLIKKNYNKIRNEFVKMVILLSIFFVSIAYLVDASYNPFLYFRF